MYFCITPNAEPFEDGIIKFCPLLLLRLKDVDLSKGL